MERYHVRSANRSCKFRKEDYQEGPLREVCILQIPLDDALLQGETKKLHEEQ